MGTIISTTTGTGIVLSNSADNPVSVTGTITVASGYALYGIGGGSNSWTIDNAGLISSLDGRAVALGSTGVPVVQGTLTNEATGHIAGSENGVFVYGPGAITNLSGGTISGTSGNGVHFTGGLGTVVNFGTILGTQYGVYEDQGGSVTNQSGATISGAGVENAIYVQNDAATIVNAGSLYGTVYGVVATSGGSIVNQSGGTITGAYAAIGMHSGTASYVNNEFGGLLNGDISITGVAGTVVNGGSLNGYHGIVEAHGGSVTNQAAGTIDGGITVNGAAGTVVNGGYLTGYYGIVESDGGSVTNLDTGTIHGGISVSSVAGTVVNGGYLSGNYGIAVFHGGSVTNLATGTIEGGITVNGATGTILNGGAVTGLVKFGYASALNLLVLDPGEAFQSGATGGGGEVQLTSAAGAGTLYGFGSAITNFDTLLFDSGAQWAIAGNGADAGLGTITIDGFASGDTIDLTGFAAIDKTFASNALVLTDAGNANTTLHIHGDFAASDFQLATDNSGGTFITVNAACYAAGTHIQTPSGDRLIESLAIGDLVTTRSGTARPIKWIGRRSYDGRFIAENRDVLPIRFVINALAPGVPKRDLNVSPKHALLLDDLLVPAEALVNGISIFQCRDVEAIEYLHIELDSHDVILAEGAPAETFVDCDSRGMFQNVAEYAERYPDAPAVSWRFCAARLEPEFAIAIAIRERLLARAMVRPMKGNIDVCDWHGLSGWVFDPGQPAQRIALEISYDGEVRGHVVADRYRPDLERAGDLGDGCCSFNFAHPADVDTQCSHVIEARRHSDGMPIPGSPWTLPAARCFDAGFRVSLAGVLDDVTSIARHGLELDEVTACLLTHVDALTAARRRLEASDGRPRALFIDEQFPAEGDSGGGNAALGHIAALLRIGFDVSLLAAHDPADRHGRSAGLAAIGVRPFVLPACGSIEQVIRRQGSEFALVYLHRVGVAAAYATLARRYCPQALLVYGVADLHHVRVARQAELERRADLERHAANLRTEELFAARIADVVITHSTVEAALLHRELPGARVMVVPWPVMPMVADVRFPDRNGVVFVGNFAHAPNCDAVRWLATDILPLLRLRDPGIGFRIIGADMPNSLRNMACPGLSFIGHVERLDAELAQAKLTIAPLRFGAGVKAKVLDSLAAGVPCVGTATAYEGLAVPSALAPCIADTPESIADAVARMYRDEALHMAAATAGLNYVRAHCSEARVDALLRQALQPALRIAEAA